MSKIINFEEWKHRLRAKRMSYQEEKLYRDIVSGAPVMLYDTETNAFIYPQHLRQDMAHWFGMPKPPAPSVFQLAGPIGEDEFPSPIC